MFKKLIATILIIYLSSISWSYGYTTTNNVSVAFSPNDGAEQLILDGIKTAELSIKIAAYSFTNQTIAFALLDAHNRGVTIEIIADNKSAKGKYSVVTFLANHGISVRLNSKYAIFHNKFMVIDDKHIETGSFNYSSAATHRNAENVIILWNNSEIARIYTDKWLEWWNEGEQLSPKVLD